MTDMLDVAIGVVFLYLIMSLIASAVAELIEAVLRNRARDLERGIRELVRDPKLVEEIYNHPLVNGLFKGEYDPNDKRRLPSYIPSSTFVLALLDSVENANLTLEHQESAAATIAPPAPGALKRWFLNAKRAFRETTPEHFDADSIERLKQGLDTLRFAAANDAAAWRGEIEKWFDSSMDRVSGWYKHRTTRNLFIIGLLAAIALNVDSIKIANQLMIDKPTRDMIVASATNYAKNGPPSTTDDAQKRLKDATGQLEKLGLPLGWHLTVGQLWNYAWTDQWALLRKLLGILMTAAAVSLGAPFWFDTLNKFIVVRSTVKPEEKSGKEGSKDPKSPK